MPTSELRKITSDSNPTECALQCVPAAYSLKQVARKYREEHPYFWRLLQEVDEGQQGGFKDSKRRQGRVKTVSPSLYSSDRLPEFRLTGARKPSL
jgi:hypothetical protein